MNTKYLDILKQGKQGIEKWNQWRIDNPGINPNLKMAYMRGFFMAEANLQNVDLEGANLKNSSLINANLKGANLTNANLEGAILRNADLEGANLTNANLEGAILTQANLRKTILTEAKLEGSFLQKADLSEANLEGLNLQNTNLSRTNLSKTNFRTADLSGCDLSNANLRGVNLERTNLKNVNFSNTDLSKFDFSEYDLSGAMFCGANLSQVNFSRANLSNCNFSFFDRELLEILEIFDPKRKFSRVKIRKELTNIALQIAANLNGANLEGANLEGANLRGTNLKNANLIRVNFENSQLSESQLEGANLREIKFEESNFSQDLFASILIFDQKTTTVQARSAFIPIPLNEPNIDDRDILYDRLEILKFPVFPEILLRFTNIDCPSNTIINTPFSLFIQLLLEQLDPDTELIEIEDSGMSKLPEIEVVLRTREFDILGTNTKIVEIGREDDTECRFTIIPRELGEQEIRVDFYQNQRRIGTSRQNIFVYCEEEIHNSNITQSQVKTKIEIKNEFLISPPDLELCVQLDRHNSRNIDFTLHSTKSEIDFHHKNFGQVTLQSSPEQKMQSVYQELGHLAEQFSRKFTSVDLNSAESFSQDAWKRDEERLISVGNQLWDELIPDVLKQQYWQFKSIVKSLLITSDEPWIPWEIIKPYRFNNGKEEQDPFWCEQFALSRWLSGPGTADDIPAELLLTVAPTNTNLLYVQQEVDFFQHLNSLRSSIYCIPTIRNVSDLQNYIQESAFSILHFAGHGMFDRTLPNDSAIQLTDGSIRPSDIRLNFTNIRPLVFINACHGGRVGFNFTKIGGWAEKFVNARVGVFIGAMWEVNDELALQFAETFYTALLKDNLTVAQAFQKSRQTIHEIAPYNSTWLAYTLYADPEARINENELGASKKNIEDEDEDEDEDETEINKTETIRIKQTQENHIFSPNILNVLTLIARSIFVIFCLILIKNIWDTFDSYNRNNNKIRSDKTSHEQYRIK